MTVNGLIKSSNLGKSLVHEHFLVDFIGADKINFSRWNRNEVVSKVLPYLLEAKNADVKSVFDCTPAFLGRDAELLMMLAKQSGVNIITNTGYYGARKDRHLPPWALTETADQLSVRWINEFESGIDKTTVKPGFIKIGVDSDEPLSNTHKKLVQAAGITHLKTGLTIFSHTGPSHTAFEQLDILQNLNIHPSAFVWVHAQAEKDKDKYSEAIERGAWVSLDGIGWGELDYYAESLLFLKKRGQLNRVLISHDAGWFKPGEENSPFQNYTVIFRELIPLLLKKGFSNQDFDQLLIGNPAEAISLRVRKI